MLLLCAASCSRCGTPAARDAAELLPKEWSAAISTSRLGTLATHAGAVAQLASQIPGGEIVSDTAHAFSSQLGIDLFSREGLIAAGLDPDRGAGVVLLDPPAGAPRPPWIAALPLVNPELFAQRLENVLTGRAGFPIRSEEARGNVHCVVFGRSGLNERVGYAVVRGYAVVVRGADPAAMIADASARTIDKSLASDSSLSRARTELDHADLIFLSASANPLVARLFDRVFFGRSRPGDSALGVTLQSDGVLLRLSQDLPDLWRVTMRQLFTNTQDPDGFRSPQAPVEFRASTGSAQLPALLSQIPMLRDAIANLRAAMASKGADLDRDLFAVLSPGASASIDLGPNANLGRALDPSLLNFRARSPFDIIRLYAVAGARDPEAIRRAFHALAQTLPSIGAEATRVAEKKQVQSGILDEWTTKYPGGEGVRFGLFVPGRDLCGVSSPARNQALVFAIGGAGSFEDVLKTQTPCAQLQTGEASQAPAPLQLQIDLGSLADAVHKLPDSAYGSGPQVFVARSLVSQVIEPLQRLRATAEVRPTDRGLFATVHLRIAEIPPGPKQ